MKKQKPMPSGAAALAEIGTRLGALAREVSGAFEAAAKSQTASRTESDARSETTTGEKTHEFSIPTPNGPIKGMASYGFRVGSVPPRSTGRSAAEKAADFEVKPARARPAPARNTAARDIVAPQASPDVEIFDEGSELLLVAEWPGASESTLSWHVEATTLTLEAPGATPVRRVAALPCAVEPASSVATLRNGILNLRLIKSGTCP